MDNQNYTKLMACPLIDFYSLCLPNLEQHDYMFAYNQQLYFHHH